LGQAISANLIDQSYQDILLWCCDAVGWATGRHLC